jgi:hypothetical protein
MPTLGSSQTGTQTTTTAIDPDVKAAYATNIGYAREVANNLGSQQTAGFDPLYQAGEAQAIAAAQGGLGMQNLNAATDLTRAAAGYSPTQAVASQADMSNISKYYNPYQQDVIDATLADINRSKNTALQQMGEKATAAKAYGGSRQGVAEAQTNALFANQATTDVAKLRSQGFNTANDLMQADLTRQQQATLANQLAGISGANIRLGAANQYGNQAALQQDAQYLAANNLMGLGGNRQKLNQTQLDAERNLGLQRLNLMQGALALNPANLGGTTSQPIYENQASTLAGLGLAGAKIASLFPSDRRLKTNIKAVGKMDNGLTVYSYNYKSGGPSVIGVMADEVAMIKPNAYVKGGAGNGFDAVDYSKL